MGMIGLCFDPNAAFLRGKRKLRSLFWRLRAEIKRQHYYNKSHTTSLWFYGKNKKEFSFQYDPFSYALNFDNGDFGFLC